MKNYNKIDPIHPFPARMAPSIALEILATVKKPLRVLDPMMGSGTVLAVARSKGHYAIGVDIDPLAVLLSKVWTTTIDSESVRKEANEVLNRAIVNFASLSLRNSYHPHADPETRKFIRYWFDEYARRQLASLALVIEKVRDETIRSVLWCAFSRLIISKQSGASLAMDLSHSRPHKSFERAPIKPFRKFIAAVDSVVDNCVDRGSSNKGPITRTHQGDARALPLKTESIDLVLTSPPYLNAIDYIRCSKFTLVWMGYNIGELRQLRGASVGAEASKGCTGDDVQSKEIISELKLQNKLGLRDKNILARYIDDMRLAIREVSRVLRPDGKAVYVVGENTVRGVYIRNSRILTKLAALYGLQLTERSIRKLPANRRYLPPPGAKAAALDSRMRSEVVLSFKKLIM